MNFGLITGSQHLYGPETLEQVAKDSQAMVDGLNASGKMPCKNCVQADSENSC